MTSPLLLQINFPDLAEFATWSADRGLFTMACCAQILLVALNTLIRLALRQRRANMFADKDNSFLATFRESAHVLALFQEDKQFQGSPHWQVYLAGCRELAFHLIGTDRVEENFSARLSAAGRISSSQMKAVRRAMTRAAGEIELDYHSVTSPNPKAGSFIRWTGLALGMVVFAQVVLSHTGDHNDISRLILPFLLPAGLSILLSLMVSDTAASMIRSTTAAMERLHLFPAELSIMIERTFVDHGAHPIELPSVATLGAPALPSFNLPPADSITRIKP